MAEKRRRNRINDRLQALREVVPVAASTNTGEFLAELLGYVTQLQALAGVAPRQALPASAGALAPLVAAAATASEEAEEEAEEDADAAEEEDASADASAGGDAASGELPDGPAARKRRRAPGGA
jgi:hypothetical protein